MNNLPGKCKKNLETAFINIYFRKFPPPNPPASPCRLGRGQSPSLPLNFSGFPPGLGLPSPAHLCLSFSFLTFCPVSTGLSDQLPCPPPPPPHLGCVCIVRSSSLTPISCCFPVLVYVPPSFLSSLSVSDPCGSQPQASQRPHLLYGSGSVGTEQP